MIVDDSLERNKTVVIEALTIAYAQRNFSYLEKYFALDYVQHNPFIPPGRDGLRNFIATLPPEARYEAGMAVAEGQYVMVHGRYSGSRPKARLAVASSNTGTSSKTKCRQPRR
jgi:predicted SnoaL-like aldol condensation-catalyzing enzyme